METDHSDSTDSRDLAPVDRVPESGVRDDRKRVQVGIRSARLEARDVLLDGLVNLAEVKLSGEGIQIDSTGVLIPDVQAALVITESALNHFLSGRKEESLRDLQIAILTGKVRISGKYSGFLGVPFPFTFTAVPEIEGGARLRLDPKHMSLVGAPIPGFGVQMLGERINLWLSRALDLTRLPLPLRLTSLTTETGRILLSATATIEIKPAD